MTWMPESFVLSGVFRLGAQSRARRGAAPSMSALEPISVWQVSCITPTQSQLSSAKPFSADALSAAWENKSGRFSPTA